VSPILPRLATVKLAEIMEAADCSKVHASTIRSAKLTPHVSTWGRCVTAAELWHLIR